MVNDEVLFFNAVNVSKQGDLAALAKLKAAGGSWKSAWKSIGDKTVSPEKEFAKLDRLNVGVILGEDENYPPLLREINPAPMGIYVRGEIGTKPKIAVVGTRKATVFGKETAKKFAEKLSAAGATVVSGLAIGIDAAAHEGAVASPGKTIAVLAGGLDRIYPSQNERLAEKILSLGGALISEYPLSSPTYPSRFLERNRIVGGLSLGTVVIEAPKESGALNTARWTVENNRELFVVPGAVNNPNYEGAHRLIKSGAHLVTAPEEVLDILGFGNLFTESKLKRGAETAAEPEDEDQKAVLETIRRTGSPLDIDKISALTKLTPQTVNQAITFLVIKKLVKETEEGYSI